MAGAFDLARQRESALLRQRSEPGVVAIGSAVRGVDEENLATEDYAKIQASTRSLSSLMFQSRGCCCATAQACGCAAEDPRGAADAHLGDTGEAGIVARDGGNQSRFARHRASDLRGSLGQAAAAGVEHEALHGGGGARSLIS